jgi:hypothetical protein
MFVENIKYIELPYNGILNIDTGYHKPNKSSFVFVNVKLDVND